MLIYNIFLICLFLSLLYLFLILFILNVIEKEGKAIHFTYDDKLKLVAYTRQVSHGKLDESKLPPLGVFDVIGRDRR